MVEREEFLKSYLRNQTMAYKQLRTAGYVYLSENNIWTILQAELSLEYYEVIHANLTSEVIYKIVCTHFDKNGAALGKLSFHIAMEDVDLLPVSSDELK